MKLHRLPASVLFLYCGAVAQVAPPASSELLRNATGSNDTLAAVGRLRGSLICTGALIDPSGAGASDAKAWLLTAGHCISLEPYGVIVNQPLSAQVQFNYFVDTPDRRVTVRTRAAGWSTMKGVDVGLVELDTTLGELRASGVRPLRLASAPGVEGRPVFWTGIPGSPIPPDLQFVRLGRCTLGSRVQLVEGNWIWNDELSNDCPDLYAGASGSPLFDAGSGEIIGVIGTTTLLNVEEGPDYDCQMNRPCALTAGGPVMQRDTSYASPVQGIAQCFDPANNLDVNRPGCPLDPGVQLTIRSGSNEVRPLAGGKPALWNASLSGNQTYYAYKHFAAGGGDCRNAAGYSAPIAVSSAPAILDPVGAKDGYYFLCVIAGITPAFDASWQQPAHASVRFKRLDSEPPDIGVDYELEPVQDSYRLLNMTGGGGTNGLGLAMYKRGSLSGTDCSDPQGYRVQTSIPEVVRPGDMPARICWTTSDKAGNTGNPVAFDFGPPVILPNGIRNAASLARGTVAPGSIMRVDTFNLTDRYEYGSEPAPVLAGVRMWIVDAAGATLPLSMTTAGPLWVEGVVPESAAPGPAILVVQPPDGSSLSQAFTIRPATPGLYSEVVAVPRGYASDQQGGLHPLVTCPSRQTCDATRLPVTSLPGGLDFVIYGTGLRKPAGSMSVRLGTHVVEPAFVRPHGTIAGLDELGFHLPQDFPLRLYQAIAVETPDSTSNYLWVYLE